MRIAHIADTHLGYRRGEATDPKTGRNLRTIDFQEATRRVLQDVIARHATEPFDLLIHAGDIFDRPRPDLADVAFLGTQIRALQDAGLPSVWIAGNHDMGTLRTPATALTLLRDTLANETTVFAVDRAPVVAIVGGAEVHLLPWGAWSAYDPPFSGELTRWPRLLVAHGEVSGDPETAEAMIHDARVPHPLGSAAFDYVALGHLHGRERYDGRTVYAGSTERSGWRDYMTEPGYAIADVRSGAPSIDVRWIDVQARHMIDLGTIPFRGDVAGLETEFAARLGEAPTDPRTALVRVTIDGVPRRLHPVTRHLLSASFEESVLSLQIDVTEPGSIVRTPLQAFARETLSLDVAALWEEYIAQIDGETEEYVSRLRETGAAAIERAIEETAIAEGAVL